jgi:hypothetical protein
MTGHRYKVCLWGPVHVAMIEFHANVDRDQVDQLLAPLLDTAEFLKHVVRMMEAAQARLIAKG